MKLGKYILQLLPENEIVIIPGFGAFISIYKPAEIDKESGEIKPPSKAINFNQKIRNNDGLLVGRIAENEGISYFDALQKIEEEREIIFYQLDKGEKVTLEKIGEFQYNDQHKIQFTSFDDGLLLLDAYGLEAVSPIQIESPEEHELDQTNSESADGKKFDLFKEENSETAPPADEAKEPEPVIEELEEREGRKNRGWLWFLLILIPLIGVGIFMLQKNNGGKRVGNASNEKLEITYNSPNVASSDSVSGSDQPDTTTVTNVSDSAKSFQTDTGRVVSNESMAETPIENLDSVKYVEPDPLKYYLVAGSFKEKENADKFFVQLENEGFNPFHLGKQGNFYILGLGVYDSEQQAFRAQDDFLEEHPGSGVWIYQVE